MINTELLKEKVLDLAMRGKLVEQDPTDGHARDLLREIQAEREQLVKDKKIKKSKPLPPISEEEIPYEIPDSWVWVRANDLLSVTMGQSPKKETINLNKDGYEFHQGKSLFTKKYLEMSDQYTKADNKVICAPAVVMSVRAPVGDVNLIVRDIFIGRGLAAFQAIGPTDINFVYHYLSTIKKSLEQVSTGSTFKAINSDVIRNIFIPLPPSKEQKRIADRINHLFKLIDHLADQQDKFNSYKKLIQNKTLDLAMQGKLVPQLPEEGTAASLLEEVTADRQRLIDEKKIKKTKPLPEISEEEIPYEIPESWEWVRLGVVSTIGNFESVTAENLNPEKHVIELEDIEKETGRLLKLRQVSDRNSKSNKYIVKDNDILYGKLRPYLRKILLSPISGYCSTEIYPFRPIGDTNSDFLLAVMKADYFQNIINRSTQGINLPRANHKVMSNIAVPLPPVKEQERIVNKLDEINRALCSEH